LLSVLKYFLMLYQFWGCSFCGLTGYEIM
jgi:hypothetical protein